jgi:hypothetical protein
MDEITYIKMTCNNCTHCAIDYINYVTVEQIDELMDIINKQHIIILICCPHRPFVKLNNLVYVHIDLSLIILMDTVFLKDYNYYTQNNGSYFTKIYVNEDNQICTEECEHINYDKIPLIKLSAHGCDDFDYLSSFLCGLGYSVKRICHTLYCIVKQNKTKCAVKL